MTDRSEAGTLDVVRVGVRAHRPEAHQPENWVIDGTRWSVVSRPMPDALAPVLKAAIVPGPGLLVGFADRVPHAFLQKHPAVASLALATPASIDLYHQLNYRGRPQARGRFSLGPGKRARLYDLAITDLGWEGAIIQQGPRTLRQSERRFLITVSLGEPFGLECYKLIAAIILLPPSIAAAL
jgi:hypothetical protein